MPKGVVEQRIGGFATEVREKLSRLEDGAGQLKGRRDNVVALLQLRDEVEDGLVKLQEQGLNITPERTRLETVDGNFKNNSRLIAQALVKEKEMAEARRAQDPEKKYWWWWTERYAGERKRKRTIIAIIAAVVLIAGGIIGKIMYDRITAADPDTQAFNSNVSLAEQSLPNGQYEVALDYYKAAEATGKPLGAERLAIMAVLYEVIGDTTNVKAYQTLARGASPSNAYYLTYLARGYMRGIKYYEKGLETVNQAISENPELAYAYYVRAEIEEKLQQMEPAVADLTKASELATQQKNTDLAYKADTRKSNLLRYGSGDQ
jgi:tetratricopeptide (TPR) repeat protein